MFETNSCKQMSEEVKNATKEVPRSMLLSLLINGILALGMLFAVLFSADHLEDLLQEDSTITPFIRIFRRAVGSNAGATTMVAIIIFLEFCSAMGCLAAASRMTWSFARDRGLPFSHSLSLVSESKLPSPPNQLTESFFLPDRPPLHYPRRRHPRRNHLLRSPRAYQHR